jgi:hypothetical protein
METIQTAMTGADAYYWFVQGFGNMERLAEAHLAPLDIPIIHAIVSPVVKGYFCYRIWTLNKRLFYLCIVIALVSVQSPYPNPSLLTWNFASRLPYFHQSGRHGVGLRQAPHNTLENPDT